MKPFPRGMAYGFSRWQVEVHQPEHFLAVRRFSLQKATADDKALAVFVALGLLGLTALGAGAAMNVLEALRRLLHPGTGGIHWRETAVSLGGTAVWLGALYLAWPKVHRLEADREGVCFGLRRWPRGQVRAVRLRWERYDSTPSFDEMAFGAGKNTVRLLTVSLQEADGRWRKVWSLGATQRARTVAAAWVRNMAQVAGLPLEEKRG